MQSASVEYPRGESMTGLIPRLSHIQTKNWKKEGETGTFCHVRKVMDRKNTIPCGKTKPQSMYYLHQLCVVPSQECYCVADHVEL